MVWKKRIKEQKRFAKSIVWRDYVSEPRSYLVIKLLSDEPFTLCAHRQKIHAAALVLHRRMNITVERDLNA